VNYLAKNKFNISQNIARVWALQVYERKSKFLEGLHSMHGVSLDKSEVPLMKKTLILNAV